jgi:hypothetical protein
VYALADQHPAAQIIITTDIDPERAKAIQHHYPTMHLKPNATVQGILWELSYESADLRVLGVRLPPAPFIPVVALHPA